MISTSDFKSGLAIILEGNIFEIMEFQHVKPGKGGAFVTTKLKNLRTGAIISYTFNAGVKVEDALIEKKAMNYLYDEGEYAVFMDNVTYEQIEIHRELISDQLQYLIMGQNVSIKTYKDEVLGLELPDKVSLTVSETPPGEKGNSATNVLKEATLETGIKIRVPLFINSGDKIIVNTTTGKYDTRAKE